MGSYGFAEMKILKCTVLAVILLGFLDVATTLLGVHQGTFRELNPILRNALEAHVGWFLLLKAGLTCLWAGVMIREQHRRWLAPVNVGIAGGYAMVVVRSAWLLLAF